MADRRGARLASRRKTPTPQPPSRATTPQPARASRTRTLRSASRDIEQVIQVQKPTRRSARQASVTTVTSESEHEGQTARKTLRNSAKETLGDLTTVEEIDTQIALEDVPGTPERAHPEAPIPFRSPGAASEMSGTTAISSFSMVEADFLEPKFILKHLRKLCDSSQEFLEHIAPDSGGVAEDLKHISEIQKPDSDYTEEYRDFDIELNVHLKHFKSEEHNYIHVRALHRALFGPNGDVMAAQSGLDLILYLTNLLVFAKQMIHSDRNAKEIWDVLRQLDNTFPGPFIPSLKPDTQAPGTGKSASGKSVLLQETFELALELRTQLAILVLQRAAGDDNFDPDKVLVEIFFLSESSQAVDGSFIRGWNVTALGGDTSTLPQEFQIEVTSRLRGIRTFFKTDDASLQTGDLVDLEEAEREFPWEATILRLLHWVRLRHRELGAAIEDMGGAAAVARTVKQTVEDPQPVEDPGPIIEQAKASTFAQESPPRKRKSFGRERRRSSRKFDPNAPVDLRTIDTLIAWEQEAELNGNVNAPNPAQEDLVAQVTTQGSEEPHLMVNQHDDEQTALGDDEPQAVTEQVEEQQAEEGQVDEQSPDAPPIVRQTPKEQHMVGLQLEEAAAQFEEPETSGPSKSTADILKALKTVSNPQKENRPTSIFDRLPTAQRVEFGDGFDDTQPTPGPSNKVKGKQPMLSSPRKRSRPAESDENSDSDTFETEARGSRVASQRAKAPVSKKVRIDPVSSGAPPSHQPPSRRSIEDRRNEDSVSETDAPDTTKEAPLPSTYQAQRLLALQNRVSSNGRKPPEKWTHEAEETLMEYMSEYSCQYSRILEYDRDIGSGLLQNRTQVNLKDKVRVMAINMIKSGTGLRKGFEGVITLDSKHGKILAAQGFEW